MRIAYETKRFGAETLETIHQANQILDRVRASRATT